ncbi:MAG: type III-B CRISPR module-associated protein Cmr5 [Desulfurococcaceae archaeon]|jgi:CRISPR type III-B/RAMP module-associated protein Cmr5|nr:type III-B CRISPR module-associated protein Cmr5 [Desulfurococcaceae archaeon]
MSEIVKDVVECIELVADLGKVKGGSEIASRFRTRARSIPSVLFTNGFTYTITLLAARSSRSFIELGFRDSCKAIVDEAVKMFNEGRADKEEVSYGLYGALLVYLLRRMGATKTSNFKELVTESIGNIALDLKAWQVIEWVKRFAEAYIEEKR